MPCAHSQGYAAVGDDMARGKVRFQPDDSMLEALGTQRKGFTSIGWSWEEF